MNLPAIEDGNLKDIHPIKDIKAKETQYSSVLNESCCWSFSCSEFPRPFYMASDISEKWSWRKNLSKQMNPLAICLPSCSRPYE